MKALITGISGQDGSYLAEQLLERGYEVVGVIRRASTPCTERIAHLMDRVSLVDGDVSDGSFVMRIVNDVQPDEVYNLAAQSFVPTSWAIPRQTMDVNVLGTINLLETLRTIKREVRFYQASSSEMFGKARTIPQSEETPFYPRSPYGVSKVAAHQATINYRESFGLFGCAGILFNHESPRRGREFVTQKICMAVAAIKAGKRREVNLGNLDAKRDWGYAPDYVAAMRLMLQQDVPDEFVVASGETHSVAEFAAAAFECVDLNWRDYVRVDESLIRPAEVDLLLGDSSKAQKRLKWAPTVTFQRLVEIMVEAQLRTLKAG